MLESAIFEKIRFCIEDVESYKDLIEINDTECALTKRYSLLKGLMGNKIKNRVENLIIACWSAKDHLKKDIAFKINKEVSEVFEQKLYNHSEVDLIQYLADAIKHNGVNPKRLRQNRYLTATPTLDKTHLRLMNKSFPGEMKPTFYVEGSNVPGFEIESVSYSEGGSLHYNYDDILLTIKILDNQGVTIGDTTNLVLSYVSILKQTYGKIVRV